MCGCLLYQVVVHHSSSPSMNFLAKNFSYTTMPFGQFLDATEGGEKMYLRSLSSTRPADKATDLATDFPSIASDFRLPPELGYVTSNAHSSPLRISGPVAMWLHYDVSETNPRNAVRRSQVRRSWRTCCVKCVAPKDSCCMPQQTSVICSFHREHLALLWTCLIPARVGRRR